MKRLKKSQVHSFDQVKTAPSHCLIHAESAQYMKACETGGLLIKSMFTLDGLIDFLITAITDWLKLLFTQLDVDKHNRNLGTSTHSLLGDCPVVYFPKVVDPTTTFKHLIQQWILIKVICIFRRVYPEGDIYISICMGDWLRRNHHKLS